MQYVLVGMRLFNAFTVFIPVYVFFAIPVISALANDPQRFLERTAKIQWGITVCVYGMSHAPALLLLDLPSYRGARRVPRLLPGRGRRRPHRSCRRRRAGACAAVRSRARSAARSRGARWALGAGAAAVVGAAARTGSRLSSRSQALVAWRAIAGAAGTLGEFVMTALKRDAGVRNWGGAALGHRRGRPARPRRAALLRCAGVLPLGALAISASDGAPADGAIGPARSVSNGGHARSSASTPACARRASASSTATARALRLRRQRHDPHRRSRRWPTLPGRLKVIFDGVREIAARYAPTCASIEIVFVNVNPQATLLLGQARGAALTALVAGGLAVAEYTALQMKKAIVGHGQAKKEQVQRW